MYRHFGAMVSDSENAGADELESSFHSSNLVVYCLRAIKRDDHFINP
jgi:hypothetical protein